MNDFFTRFSTKASQIAGRSWAFALACGIVLGWIPSILVIGSIDTWQLIINTLTTIITFLLIVLLQNTLNRDMAAMHIKLDAIIKKLGIKDDELAKLETMTDKALEKKQEAAQKGVK